MTNLLVSKPSGINHQWESFSERFLKLICNADTLSFASGYVSVDSLVYLQDFIDHQELLSCELIIGMYASDRMTISQYNAAKLLNDKLKEYKRGEVFICQETPYHGKLYSFQENNEFIGSLVGSSNFSNFASKDSSHIEVDLFSDNIKFCQETQKIFDYIKTLTIPFQLWKPPGFKKTGNSLLSGFEDVKKVNSKKLKKIKEEAIPTDLSIPLKTTKKSNLNIYFGKGRKDKKGKVNSRPWYEIELIIPKAMGQQPGYPQNTKDNPMTVITDDDWSFQCYRSGDYLKNFRSKSGLQILGKWIKGRMEEAGVLIPGEFISDAILTEYGKDRIELLKTSQPDVWVLDFSRPEVH